MAEHMPDCAIFRKPSKFGAYVCDCELGRLRAEVKRLKGELRRVKDNAEIIAQALRDEGEEFLRHLSRRIEEACASPLKADDENPHPT